MISLYITMYILEGTIRTKKLSPQERIDVIPAIFYGRDIEQNIQLSINRKAFMQFLYSVKKNCYSTLLKLKFDKHEHDVCIKDIQWHKLTTNPEHIDFFSIKNVDSIHVNYNIRYENKDSCLGVKAGGKMRITQKQCEASVNPFHMTPDLEVDLKNLKIGEKFSTEMLEKNYAKMNLQINKKTILVSISG